MKPQEVLRYMVETRGLSQRQASVKAGRTKSFIGFYLSKGRKPSLEVLSDIAHHLGFTFVLRDNETGKHIVIDPPE